MILPTPNYGVSFLTFLFDPLPFSLQFEERLVLSGQANGLGLGVLRWVVQSFDLAQAHVGLLLVFLQHALRTDMQMLVANHRRLRITVQVAINWSILGDIWRVCLTGVRLLPVVARSRLESGLYSSSELDILQ